MRNGPQIMGPRTTRVDEEIARRVRAVLAGGFTLKRLSAALHVSEQTLDAARREGGRLQKATLDRLVEALERVERAESAA